MSSQAKKDTATPLIRSQDARGAGSEPMNWNTLAGVALFVVALVFVLGTVIDFSTLWFFQRQDQPTWEFVALSNIAEGLGRPILGLGLMFAGSSLAGWHQRWLQILLSLGSLFLGLIALGVTALIGTDYVVLAPLVEGNQLISMKVIAVKAATLGTLYGLALIPLGIFGFRATKRR